MGDTDSGSAIVADISGEVFKLVAPGLLEWLRTTVFGKKMIVVGVPMSGKTTFVNYLCTGELGDKDVDPGRTEPDKPPVKSVIQINTQTKFELRLKKIGDSMGQAFEQTQAKWAVEANPHVMMIFLKMNSETNAMWLTNFLTAYASKLRNQKDQLSTKHHPANRIGIEHAGYDQDAGCEATSHCP